MQVLGEIKSDIKKLASSKQAQALQRYFKTGKGEYGEGDIFIGLSTPNARMILKKYRDLPLTQIKKLLTSKIHEERGLALGLLVHRFQKGDRQEKQEIYKHYLKSTKYINNWDLVDCSAHKIVGEYLSQNPKESSILKKLARSKNLWERRIAIISTFRFIRDGKFDQALGIAQLLLHDSHDLIHKAVGWTLREVGKKSQEVEEEFLRKNYPKMPRTMLRYAIERFPEKLRQDYLQGKI